MENYRVLVFGLIFVIQVFKYGSCEEKELCHPGFKSEIFIFKVNHSHLPMDMRLGRVLFDDCNGSQSFHFNVTDYHFDVESDGTVLIRRPLTLHDGHKRFFVHTWDSKGKKISARVLVQYKPKTSNVTHSVENIPPEQSEFGESVPQSSTGHKRRQREHNILLLIVNENEKGPFPKHIVQIKSNKNKEVQLRYSITGSGADKPPKGIFIVDESSGWISVTQSLDREKCSNYTLLAHATSLDNGVAEAPMKIIIRVSDQNDNKPVFTQDVFLGSVPEATQPGYEIMNVTATDADDPETYNADLRYSIVSQNPQLPSESMFAINPTNGVIRLNNAGLDKEEYPLYTLTIQVADLEGQGFAATCKAIITVTQ